MTHSRLLRHPRTSYVGLGQNAAHKMAAEHALVHYASGTVYSFIPKNGCSTMRLTLAIENACIASPDEFAWIHPNNATFRASLQELVTANYTFAILRCPFRRLASAFLDKIVGRSGDFWQLHRHFGDQPNPDFLTFRQFVDLIAPEQVLALNIHWRPQTDFLVYQTYDDLFCIERFNEVAPRLKEKSGLTLIDARPYTKHGTDTLEKVTGETFSDVPAHKMLEMRRNGQVPDYAALYDEPLQATVQKMYQKDFSLYKAQFGASDLLFDVEPTRKAED